MVDKYEIVILFLLQVFLDFDSMTRLDLVFRTEQKIHCFKVELYTGGKRGTGRVDLGLVLGETLLGSWPILNGSVEGMFCF